MQEQKKYNTLEKSSYIVTQAKRKTVTILLQSWRHNPLRLGPLSHMLPETEMRLLSSYYLTLALTSIQKTDGIIRRWHGPTIMDMRLSLGYWLSLVPTSRQKMTWVTQCCSELKLLGARILFSC